MALKQMSMARMGPYRSKFGGVNEGGKTGRPKLLHNGTGHGLTGGGGLNAKGSGGGIHVSASMKPMQRQLRKSRYAANKNNAMKINERQKNAAKRADAKTRTTGGPRMNPHPVGNFMYGQGQWATIGQGGMVNWNATKPMAGKPTIGFNEALPWLRSNPAWTTWQKAHLSGGQRRVAPAAYWDPTYFRNKGTTNLEYNTALAQLGQQKNQLQHDYDWSLKDLDTDYQANTGDVAAAASQGNIAGSGISAHALGELARQLGSAQAKNLEQYNLSTTENSAGMTQAKQAHDLQISNEESGARERWMATHQGEKLPASRKGQIYNEGGVTYRQNAQGIPMTWKQAKAAKPLHPNAKTFTNKKTGQVMNFKGK